MTERERLKKLLAECMDHPENTCPMPTAKTCEGCKYDLGCECDMSGRYVDYLLANGVTLPPVKIGQTVYSLEKGIYSQFFNGEVYEIQIRREGVVFRATRRGYYTLAFTEENIGKTVFFTPEEAEAALAERSKT